MQQALPAARLQAHGMTCSHSAWLTSEMTVSRVPDTVGVSLL